MNAHVRLLVLLLAVLSPFTSPSTASGQGILQVEPLHGELTLGYDGRVNRSGAANSNTQLLREWVTVKLGGSVLGPNIAAFDLALRPAFSQGWWTGSSIEGTERGGRNGLYGDGNLTLFKGENVEIGGRLFRSQDIVESRFDQRTESDAEGFVVRGNFRSTYMNVSAVYDQNSTDAIWTSAVASGGRRLLDRSQFAAFVTNSKTKLRFRRLTFDDLLRQDDEYLRNTFSGTNDQKWGKGSRLQSRVNWTEQEGAGAVRNLNWGQSVHLQHTRDISTNLSYYVSDVSTMFDDTNGWGTVLHEAVRLDDSWRLSLDLGADGRKSNRGSFFNWRVMPRGQVTVPLPAGIRFDGGAGVGYQYRSQETAEEGGYGSILAEPHVVPISRRFLLDQPNADPATVRVTSEDAVVTYTEGTDYRLFESGVFLEVIALPGGRILPEQSVFVDYRFALLPTADGGIVRWEYNIAFTVKGFQLYHSLAGDEKAGQTENETPLFGETDNAIAGIRYDAPTPLGPVRLAGEWRRTAFNGVASESFSLDGSLSFGLGPKLLGRFGAGWSSRRDGSRYYMFRALTRLTWKPLRRLNVYGDLSAYAYEYSTSGGESFFGGAIGADWVVGRTAIGGRLERSRWDRSLVRNETRFVVKLSRAF
jgi:hypothetical protein